MFQRMKLEYVVYWIKVSLSHGSTTTRPSSSYGVEEIGEKGGRKRMPRLRSGDTLTQWYLDWVKLVIFIWATWFTLIRWNIDSMKLRIIFNEVILLVRWNLDSIRQPCLALHLVSNECEFIISYRVSAPCGIKKYKILWNGVQIMNNLE